MPIEVSLFDFLLALFEMEEKKPFVTSGCVVCGAKYVKYYEEISHIIYGSIGVMNRFKFGKFYKIIGYGPLQDHEFENAVFNVMEDVIHSIIDRMVIGHVDLGAFMKYYRSKKKCDNVVNGFFSADMFNDIYFEIYYLLKCFFKIIVNSINLVYDAYRYGIMEFFSKVHSIAFVGNFGDITALIFRNFYKYYLGGTDAIMINYSTLSYVYCYSKDILHSRVSWNDSLSSEYDYVVFCNSAESGYKCDFQYYYDNKKHALGFDTGNYVYDPKVFRFFSVENPGIGYIGNYMCFFRMFIQFMHRDPHPMFETEFPNVKVVEIIPYCECEVEESKPVKIDIISDAIVSESEINRDIFMQYIDNVNYGIQYISVENQEAINAAIYSILNGGKRNMQKNIKTVYEFAAVNMFLNKLDVDLRIDCTNNSTLRFWHSYGKTVHIKRSPVVVRDGRGNRGRKQYGYRKKRWK